MKALSRGVAQLGRALPWGGRGRTFESCRSDQYYQGFQPFGNKAKHQINATVMQPFFN